MLQGLPKPERRSRTEELLERVGLTEAADRKVGGYSGGMKRRLDLALALVHRPRVLFLDEPTTGLDPQSRTALWDEVGAARARGRRHGVPHDAVPRGGRRARRPRRDHRPRPDRRRRDAGRPQGGDRPPERPRDPGATRTTARGSPSCSPRSASRSARTASSRCGSDEGIGLADVVRGIDAEGVAARTTSSCARRRSTTSSSRRRAGRSRARRRSARSRRARRRRARVEAQRAAGARTRSRRSAPSRAGRSAARCASRRWRSRRSSSPSRSMLVNAAGLEPSTLLPGFPTDSFLAFALAVPFIQGALFATMNAGTDLARDIQTGFLNRLSLTSLRGSSLLVGQLAGIVVLGLVQAVFYIAVGLIVGVDFAAGAGGIAVLLVFSFVVSLGFGALGSFLALRTGSGEAVQGMFPLLFVFLFISSMNTPRDLIAVDWFRWAATAQPRLVPDRVRPQPDHHGLGREGARARLRRRDRRSPRLARARLVGAHAEDDADVSGRRLAGRERRRLADDPQRPPTPALLLPTLLFPLFFFTAFAGGLSQVREVPGFDYDGDYTSFQFVFVLLQSAAFGGVFTGFGIARDFEGGFGKRLLLASPNRIGILLGYALAALVALERSRRRSSRRSRSSSGWTSAAARSTSSASTRSRCSQRRRASAGRPASRSASARSRSGPLMQMPVFLLLFFAPVYVPLDLLTRLDRDGRDVQPGHATSSRRAAACIVGRPDRGRARVRARLRADRRVRRLGRPRPAPRRGGGLARGRPGGAGYGAPVNRTVWPGAPFPLGPDVGRQRDELLALQRERRARRALPVRRARREERVELRQPDGAQLARLPPGGRARAALRLPRPRARGSRRRGTASIPRSC